jgi:glycosyltransferase involved in cell wall biosynthesis
MSQLTGLRGSEKADHSSRLPRRLRILHVLQNLNYGGLERMVAGIVRCADSERVESHVMVLQYLGRFSEGLEEVATLHSASPMTRLSMVWPRTLVRQVRGIAPDVVHSHSGVWYKASLAARLAGVPRVIHTDHGRQDPDPWHARFLDGIASRRTNVAVAVSDAVADLLKRSVVSRKCRVSVIVNGVDTEFHSPVTDDGRVHAELGIDPGTPIIGSIGRLEHIKGYDYMVEAFVRLSSEWPGARAPVLVLAGDGAERQRLERDAFAAGVAARVHFLGWRDDVRRLLGAFTIFTMSSRSEGTSVSLLEAMSSGVCPVVTDVGGNAAVLGSPLQHRLAPPHDPAALAAAWSHALADTPRAEADAAAARARVKRHYSLQQTVDQYQRLYADEDEAETSKQPAADIRSAPLSRS